MFSQSFESIISIMISPLVIFWSAKIAEVSKKPNPKKSFFDKMKNDPTRSSNHVATST